MWYGIASHPKRHKARMPDHVQEPDDFAITAQISLVEQRFRTLKHNDMFGVFDQRGDIRPGPGGTEGLYFNDTRYLSEFELVVAGRQLVLLSSTLRDDNATLTCDLSNPDLPHLAGDGEGTDGLRQQSDPRPPLALPVAGRVPRADLDTQFRRGGAHAAG